MLRFLFGATLIGAVIPTVHAATTAGTEIRNQSTATYLDPSGNPQISTSNEVINTVAAVYSVVVTPNASTGAPVSYGGTPALNQTTAAGNVAYYSYILENTGNSPDTYNPSPDFEAASGAKIAPGTTGVEVYFDANGNGFVDAGDTLLATRSAAGTLTASSATPVVDPSEKISLVVAVHTPATATVGQEINTDFQVTGVTGGATDAVSNWNQTKFLSGKGIMTAYKSANVTSAKAGDTLTYTVQGSNTGSASVFSKIFDNTTATKIDNDSTLTDGEVVEGILIEDILDATKLNIGANYANVTITVDAPSTAIPVYWDETNDIWSTSKVGVTPGASYNVGGDNAKVGLFIPDADSVDETGDGGSDATLAPGQSYKFSFTVPVVSPLVATSIENFVTAEYRSDATTDAEADSNINIVTIGGDPGSIVVDVTLSPYTFADGTGGDTDVTNGTTRGSQEHPQVDSLGLVANEAADTTTAGIEGDDTAHRNAGTTIVFPLTVTNPSATSSATDVFNITYANPSSGYTVILFKADGITPLADTNGDGLPDVGQLAPGGFADLVAKVTLADGLVDAGGETIIVTATSTLQNAAGGSTVSNTTSLVITEVRPAGVDIATDGQIAGDDSATSSTAADENDDDDATATSVNPGSTFVIPFDIANMRNHTQNAGANDETTTAADTYNITVTPVTAGASAFAYVLFDDTNADGVLDPSELDPITDTGSIVAVDDADAPTATEIYDGLLRVTIPSTTIGGDYYIAIKATSTNNSAQSDTMHVKITVATVPEITITPDNTATVVRGGTVTFKHVVTNTGNVDDDAFLTLPTLPTGYTAVFVSCTDGSVLGTGEAYDTSGGASLAPGDSIDVCVRVFVPANASIGNTTPVVVTATLGAGLASDDAVDVITVIDGNLDLQKVNSPTTAVAPGGVITYTTTFRQLGSANITNVLVFDAVPANSNIVVVDYTGTVTGADVPKAVLPDGTAIDATNDPEYFEYSTNGGLSWISWDTTAPTATNGVDSSITNIRLDLSGDNDVAVATATMTPGQSGTFTFSVLID
ncbi:MAG: DUF11 domain-containing protein [Synoicihabitans sp.]